MSIRLFALVCGWCFFGALSGCATTERTTWEPGNPWLDREFAYTPALIDATAEELFALPAELLLELRSAKMQRASTDYRIQYIVDTLVENKKQPFLYAVGHSTVAAQTWRSRAGDCLSLTVLAYAIGHELKLAVTMQEVQGAVLFDRRGSIDFRVGHVNVFVQRHVASETTIATSLNRGVVIDFEPRFGAARPGKVLSRQAILARYYNNLGAEYLAKGQPNKAYAHFKAAMQTDPAFTAAATNLAWLYWHAGYAKATEAVLVMAVDTSTEPDAAARGLHRLLLSQGRAQEAQYYQAMMEARQKHEPYFWIDQGLNALQAHHYGRAVESLERALALTSGFSEVHRYLAVAYMQDGKLEKAQEQLAVLSQLEQDDPALQLIARKLSDSRKTRL